MKYLLFGNNVGGCGFGNQIRAFVGAYIWSKILNREFVTNNHWFVNYFELPIKTTLESNLSIKPCFHDKDFLFNRINFNDFEEDILEFGGGMEVSLLLFENEFHRDSFNYFLNQRTYFQVVKESLKLLLSNLKNEIKRDYNFKYNSVQFRSFYDVNFQNYIHLDEFLNYFVSKSDKGIPVFVTSDDSIILQEIINKLVNYGFQPFTSDLVISHTAFSNSPNPLIDWYILGNSNEIYSTGTSFSKTASLIFDTPIYIFDKLNNFFGHLNETNFTHI